MGRESTSRNTISTAPTSYLCSPALTVPINPLCSRALTMDLLSLQARVEIWWRSVTSYCPLQLLFKALSISTTVYPLVVRIERANRLKSVWKSWSATTHGKNFKSREVLSRCSKVLHCTLYVASKIVIWKPRIGRIRFTYWKYGLEDAVYIIYV